MSERPFKERKNGGKKHSMFEYSLKKSNDTGCDTSKVNEEQFKILKENEDGIFKIREQEGKVELILARLEKAEQENNVDDIKKFVEYFKREDEKLSKLKETYKNELVERSEDK